MRFLSPGCRSSSFDARQFGEIGVAVGLFQRRGVGEPGFRRVEADLGHRLAEKLTILGLVDGLGRGADHLDTVLVEDAHFLERRAQFSAVWPPMVGRSASGRSFSMILATISGVIGST